jgi:hypothetical protein
LQRYRPIQTKEATILVSSLLAASASTLHPEKHFRRFAASTIMSILYDHPTIVSEHDPTIERIEEFNNRLTRAAVPGSNLVNLFPWMLHIPERSRISFRVLMVYTDTVKKGSQTGSEKAYDILEKTMTCSEAFSTVCGLTLWVLVLTVGFRDRETDNTGRRRKPTKFQRIPDTKY